MSLLLSLLLSLAHGFTLIDQDITGYDEEPVVVHLNPNNCPAGVSGALDEAVDFWNGSPHSSLILERGANVSYSVADMNAYNFAETIVVYCSIDINTDAGGDPDTTLGQGGVARNDPGSTIDKGRLIINATPGGAANFSNSDGATVELTFAHELGHTLGLGHSSEPAALMYFSAGNKTAANLHQDDIDGIRHLYPQDELSGEYLLGCARIKDLPPPKNPPWELLSLLALFLLWKIQDRTTKSKA